MPSLILEPAPGHPRNLDGDEPRHHAQKLEVAAGTPVLDAALSARFPIATLCGGAMACQTCRVVVVSGAAGLSPCGVKERALLDEQGAPAGARFACQARLLEGSTEPVVVRVPAPTPDDDDDEAP